MGAENCAWNRFAGEIAAGLVLGMHLENTKYVSLMC